MPSGQTTGYNIPIHTEGQARNLNPHDGSPGVRDTHDYNSNSTPYNPPANAPNRLYDANSLNPSTGPDSLDPTSPHANTEEHPKLSETPTPAGGVPGVAIGHTRDDLPVNASWTDKAIGKTEKVAGKVTRNPERTGRGERREVGGGGAAHSGVRAPYA